MQPALGTFVEIGLATLPGADSDRAFARAFERIQLIGQLMSFHKPDSDLTRLNCNPGQVIKCHPLTLRCLRLAKAMTWASQGRFNCTLGANLVRAGVLPDHGFFDSAAHDCEPRPLAVGESEDIELWATHARLRRPVLITLDGIAKGFALDSAIGQLKAAGMSAGWINAGGDIRSFGDLVLPVSLRDHLGQDHPLGGLQNAALATSTAASSRDYPGQLLDSQARPVAASTWSIMAHFAWRADALTKIAANLPADWTHTQKAAELARLGGRWVPIPVASCQNLTIENTSH